MKTTVELPDELVIEAKKLAVELRRPLRALIEDALRAHLREARRVEKPRSIRWVTVDGGLPEDLDVADRAAMMDWSRTRRDSD